MISFGKFLAPRALVDFVKSEADAIIERWDVPHEVVVDGKTLAVAKDLDDRLPRWQGMKDGRRIAGRIYVDDMRTGGPSPATPLAFGAVAASTIVAMVLGSIWSGFLPVGILLIAASLVFVARATGSRGWAIGSLLLAALAASSLMSVGAPSPMAWLGFRSSIIGHITLPAIGIMLAILVFVGWAVMAKGLMSGQAIGDVLVSAVGVALLYAISSHLPSWLAPLCLFLPLIALPWLYARHIDRVWRLHLAIQEVNSRGETSGSSPHSEARWAQAVAAAKDNTPLIALGTATGFLTDHLDGFAPDPGIVMCMSSHDFATHMLIVGETGSGKTSSALRPIITHWVRGKCGGLLVLDGKGGLPGELRRLKGYTLIEPGVKFALIEGLSVNDVVSAIAGVAVGRGDGDESSQFFKVNGQSVLFQGAVMLRALVTSDHEHWKWTLLDLHTLLSGLMGSESKAKMEETIAALQPYKPASEGQKIVFHEAVKYFSTVAPDMDHETRANIWSTINGWLSPIFQHEDLVEWSRTEHGVDIGDITRGGLWGVNLPAVRYERAGVLVQKLVKQRVFAMLRERGDGWRKRGETPVLFVTDEAQEIVSGSDEDFLPVARSLGGACVYASQSVEALMSRLGRNDERRAAAWLGNLVSRISLRSTPGTTKWVAESLGEVRRPHFQTAAGYLRVDKSLDAVFSSALYDPNHPGAKVMRALRRRGAGQLVSSWEQPAATQRARGLPAASLSTADLLIPTIEQVKWEVGPLMTPAEINAKLAAPGYAVAQLKRGGVVRRDVIRLNYMPEFPDDLLDKDGPKATTGESDKAKVSGEETPEKDIQRSMRSPKPQGEQAVKPSRAVEPEPAKTEPPASVTTKPAR